MTEPTNAELDAAMAWNDAHPETSAEAEARIRATYAEEGEYLKAHPEAARELAW